MMGAIWKQLVGGREIPKDIREAFQEGRRPLLPDLVRMLSIAIASLSQAFICIDALDEFLPKDLPELLESLRDIARESPKIRIFLTGRPYIRETIQRYFSKVVVMPISLNRNDIRDYLEMRLDKDDEPEAMNQDLRADIVKTILNNMSDMCVGVSPLSVMYTYQRLCIDSSLFHSISRPSWERIQLVRGERNLKRWCEVTD